MILTLITISVAEIISNSIGTFTAFHHLNITIFMLWTAWYLGTTSRFFVLNDKFYHFRLLGIYRKKKGMFCHQQTCT